MKNWKCTNCGRDSITDDSIIMIQCGCSYPMEEVNKEEKGNGDISN